MQSCPCCSHTSRSKSIRDWNSIDYHYCDHCGSAYQDPSINFTYEENYWDRITDPDGKDRVLSKERDFKIKNWYGESVQFVNEQKPGRILDVGAGMGFFLSAINNEWEKHAIEISEYSAERIKKFYQNINVINSNLNLTSFRNEFFDVIMFYHVIEHLENPNIELEILYNLLKKDGTLIIGTPNIFSLAAKVFRGNFRLFGPGHLCLFNKYSLNQILKNNGFKVFKREYPFWKTDYANLKNFTRMFLPWEISPPFYGSIMTFYAKKI